MSANEPITKDELVALFGENIPVEVVVLLFGAGIALQSPDDIRLKLALMAGRSPPVVTEFQRLVTAAVHATGDYDMAPSGVRAVLLELRDPGPAVLDVIANAPRGDSAHADNPRELHRALHLPGWQDAIDHILKGAEPTS